MRWIMLFLVLGLAAPAEAGRVAFVDPATGELKASGFVDRNEPGDRAIPVPDDFALRPGQWRWTGTDWQPYTRPEPPVSPLRQRIRDALVDPSLGAPLKEVLREWERTVP